MQLVIDGQHVLDLAAGYNDIDEEQRRIEQAVFRCEVEQVHLADGRVVLVNLRACRFLELRP